jgi:hypothetical protein
LQLYDRRMRRRPFARLGGLVVMLLVGTACGGSQRSSAADLVPQPTPDPTLDAIVRGLPHMLAGVPATPTPTLAPTAKPKPAATLKPAPAPALRVPPTPSPRPRR